MLRAGEYKGVFGRDLMFCIIVTFLDVVTTHNALSRSESDDDEFPRPSKERCNFGTATERGGVLP